MTELSSDLISSTAVQKEPEFNESTESISKYGKKRTNSSKSFPSSLKSFFLLLTIFSIVFFFFIKFKSNSSLNSSIYKKYTITPEQRYGNAELDKKNSLAMKETKLEPYPMQKFFLQKTKNFLLNLSFFIHFHKNDIDLERLINAVNETIYNHPILSSRFYEDKQDHKVYIKYSKEYTPKIEIIKIKESEISNLKEKLLHNFEPLDHQMAFFKIYVSEESISLFYDIYHTNGDGNSLLAMYETIEAAYFGEKLPKDYFYLYLKEYNDRIGSESWLQTKQYYEKNYDLINNHMPKFDLDIPAEIKNNKRGQFFSYSYVSEDIKTKLFNYLGDQKLFDYNVYMSMYILLTNYIYSDFSDTIPEYRMGLNGRDFKKEKYTMGCLITHFPIKYEFDNKNRKVNVKRFFDNIKEQIYYNRKLERFPQLDTETGMAIMSILQRDKSFYFENYLGKKCDLIYHYDNIVNEESEYLLSPVVMEFIVSDENVNIFINFDAKYYKESSFEKYKDITIKVAHFLADNLGKDEDLNIDSLI